MKLWKWAAIGLGVWWLSRGPRYVAPMGPNPGNSPWAPWVPAYPGQRNPIELEAMTAEQRASLMIQ